MCTRDEGELGLLAKFQKQHLFVCNVWIDFFAWIDVM